MKIAGIWCGHDCSFTVLENGEPLIHAEYERYNREKCPPGDAIKFLSDRSPEHAEDIVHYASVHPVRKTKEYAESFERALKTAEKMVENFTLFLTTKHMPQTRSIQAILKMLLY